MLLLLLRCCLDIVIFRCDRIFLRKNELHDSKTKLAQLNNSYHCTIVPVMCVYESKDRLGIRMPPATPATAMLYSSLEEYLEIVSHPNSYAGYIEIAAAQQLLYVEV